MQSRYSFFQKYRITVKQSDKKSVNEFRNKLERNGINATVRREMGRDIDGACGQLRKSYMDNELVLLD